MRGKIKLEESRTFGEKMADSVTSILGSWAFLVLQTCIIITWVGLNTSGILKFDSYPFIFLNLFLSLQAAYTAPVIMMSNNRHAERDRKRAEADYEVNLLAEREIEIVLRHLEELQHKHATNQRILYELNQIKTTLLAKAHSLEQQEEANSSV
jgi:uncharacterized membrane protein